MRELLRMSTAGSVDDGKSTLIGRLLLDTGSLPTDHLAAVDGPDGPDLAALSDGLRAEREQGITIDVAYRFFSTAKRNYVLADTPGHERYTRNMVTGTSNAHLAMLLVDVRAGVLDQTRRHARIATLLGVPHLVAVVNKMDLVDFDRSRFSSVREELREVADRLGVRMLVVPVAAKHGDNVANRSANTPWYDGPTLLEHLDGVEVLPPDFGVGRLRMPVQWVSRPVAGRRRSYTGRVAAGTLRAGDEVVVLPSGSRTRVTAVDTLDDGREVAVPPLSVAVELADELDVGRGDVLVAPDAEPVVTRELRAQVCWMHAEPLTPGRRLLLKHTTRTVRAEVTALHDRMDPRTLAELPAPGQLQMNDIGALTLRTAVDLVVEPYSHNRDMGAFILVDEHTHDTVAAGVVREATDRRTGPRAGDGAVWRSSQAPRPHPGAALWLLPAAGAADAEEVAGEVEAALLAQGRPSYALRAENLRAGLTADLGDSAAERAEASRRTAHAARLLADAGVVVVGTAGDAAQAEALAQVVREAGPTAVVLTLQAGRDAAAEARRAITALTGEAGRG
ncbi:GTP-binding protein [Kineococcus arenarius]|uniref:GTP-binding protein n=1 Tax=Kineococcus sp. SYSU DK007 TaxID=3383128 RepID=UPI003D7E6871